MSRSSLQRARSKGRADACAAIVAWLRSLPGNSLGAVLLRERLAAEIEAGAHRQEKG